MPARSMPPAATFGGHERVDIACVDARERVLALARLDPERLRLDKLEVREVSARTSLGFRIVTR
jgi:hypothetical protein